MTVLQSSMVVALANARLRDLDEALTRKLDATTVQLAQGSGGVGLTRSRFGATERRVLGLVRAASEMLAGPDPVTVPVASGLYPGPSKYAVLGSAGFELPAYADMFSETPGWRAAMMRRGTPDPFLSLVQVPTATFVNAVGARTVADAAGDDAKVRRGAAFTMGLASALAHATVTGPVQRSAYGRRTSKRWSRAQPGPHNQVNDAAALARLIGGRDPVQTFHGWWPTAEQAAPLLASYHAALEATYHLESRTPASRGWPAFETAFKAGPALTPARVKAGYERLVVDLVPWSRREWFGVLTPILLSPGLALLAGRFLPGASSFMTAAAVTERSLTELITVSDAIGSITPLIYSMIMWANVPDQPREPFISALWTFAVRVGLALGWIPTIGSETDDPSPGGRWGIAGGMLAIDVYNLVRLRKSLGGSQPGPTVVFGVQNIPAIVMLTTLAQAGIIKGVVAAVGAVGDEDDAAIAGWVAWAVTTLGLWLGAGLPIAKALSRGGGWLSWFATDDLPSLRGALADAGTALDTQDAAAAFDDSTLWHDAATATPTLAHLRYATGARPLVKVWRASGSPELEIAHAGHVVKIRNGAAVTDVVIGPGRRTVDDIVTALTVVGGVQAAAVDDGPRYDLPWPATVQDPASEADPRPPADDPTRAAFVKLSDNPDKAYVLRHAADEDLATRYGASGLAVSTFDGLRAVPRQRLADVDDTVLGTSADLAVVLGLGAASRLRSVNPVSPDPALVPGAPAVPGPIGPVAQVFRDWNLDHRRVNEWRTIVAGGASREAPPPADAGLAEGARIAEAMGWVPLWRAWLRVASDTQQDAAAATISPDTPVVRAADGSTFRPTNQQLTRGVRYLLDLTA